MLTGRAITWTAIHGERDPYANPASSTALQARLQSAGIASTLQWVVSGGHGWSPDVSIYGVISPTWSQILAMELAFFDLHLKQ